MTIIERGMQPLKVTDVKSYQVEKLHFRFDHFGWMNVFLDDMGKHGTYNAGEIAIHSDWGSWAYTWTGIAEHETLREFLCTADNDYLARKLLTGATEEWDPEGTKKELKKYIEAECPEEGFQLETWSRTRRVVLKQCLLEELERCDWDSGETLWIERMGDELSAFLGHEAWEHAAKRPTVEYTVLTEGLLPALKNYLREQAKPKLEAVP